MLKAPDGSTLLKLSGNWNLDEVDYLCASMGRVLSDNNDIVRRPATGRAAFGTSACRRWSWFAR